MASERVSYHCGQRLQKLKRNKRGALAAYLPWVAIEMPLFVEF